MTPADQKIKLNELDQIEMEDVAGDLLGSAFDSEQFDKDWAEFVRLKTERLARITHIQEG